MPNFAPKIDPSKATGPYMLGQNHKMRVMGQPLGLGSVAPRATSTVEEKTAGKRTARPWKRETVSVADNKGGDEISETR